MKRQLKIPILAILLALALLAPSFTPLAATPSAHAETTTEHRVSGDYMYTSDAVYNATTGANGIQRMSGEEYRVFRSSHDVSVLTEDYSLSQNAEQTTMFTIPKASEISAYTNPNNSRSPHIWAWLDISENTRYREFSIDFKADYLPKGTYCCVGQWHMDLSSLQSCYDSVRSEYENVHGYMGMQNTVTEKGHVSIISLWDLYGARRDAETTMRARCIYPKQYDEDDTFTGEGNGVHTLVPYDWKEGHWYRMLLQCGRSEESGNTTLEQWICDLETRKWTKLCVYETVLKDSCFVGSMCVFLENYITKYAGEVRSLEFRNVRILDNKTDKWCGITGALIGSNGGSPKYEGSYAFGATDDRFWIVTSGVGGDWYNNGKGQPSTSLQVSGCETGRPY